jgi:hypothetical protein
VPIVCLSLSPRNHFKVYAGATEIVKDFRMWNNALKMQNALFLINYVCVVLDSSYYNILFSVKEDML